MLPALAIVGRPNVGKSTLFNRLTASRRALVADFPGLTRDRQYGRGRGADRPYLIVDTGGFEPEAKSGIFQAMARQTNTAIAESDAVIFLVDGREGLTAQDQAIADLLRRSGRPLVLAVNKSEGLERGRAAAEFHELGLGEPVPISSAHGENVGEMIERALALCPPEKQAPETAREEHAERILVAIVGRPNVGKSTLVNTLLGEERVLAYPDPGTTRDSLYLDFDRAGRAYTLIDTAGVRRRGKVTETIEKFSVIKTLQAIEDANVVVLVLDALAGVSEQDAHIASHILDAGRAVVLAVNKSEALKAAARAELQRDLERKLGFLDFAELQMISALDGLGIPGLLKAVDRAYAAAMAKLPTPRLTRALQQAVEAQAPRRIGTVRPKLRYAHQGGSNPPLVVIHGSALSSISRGYRRYLEHFFRKAFKLQGTPLRIQFKSGANPYAPSATHRRKRR
jgi:GTP-binding protein